MGLGSESLIRHRNTEKKKRKKRRRRKKKKKKTEKNSLGTERKNCRVEFGVDIQGDLSYIGLEFFSREFYSFIRHSVYYTGLL
jgi:hypothetical protein